MSRKSIPQNDTEKQLSYLPQSPSKSYEIEVFKENDLEVHVGYTEKDVWLTQRQIADILGISQQSVSHQITSYKNNELTDHSTYKSFLLVQTEGKRRIERDVEHYNLEVLLQIAFRVQPNGENADRVKAFKKWVSDIVRQHIASNEKKKQSFLDKRQRAITEYINKGHDPEWSEARVASKEAQSDFASTAKETHETHSPQYGALHGIVNRELFEEMTTSEIAEHLGLLPKDADNYRDHLGKLAQDALKYAYQGADYQFRQVNRPLTSVEQKAIVKKSVAMIAPALKEFAAFIGQDFISGAALDENGNPLIARNVPLLPKGKL